VSIYTTVAHCVQSNTNTLLSPGVVLRRYDTFFAHVMELSDRLDGLPFGAVRKCSPTLIAYVPLALEYHGAMHRTS
jgi:hypothetical protein